MTGSPTATPTGTPTGSPTATPTGTPTPSPTPTATPRPDLSGQYAFLDRAGPTVDDDNQSFLNIDTGSFRFCFAGLVTELDPGPLPQPEVVFEYRSLGDIRKATQRTVRGEFISVDLTLRILENGVTQFEETITSFCSLKASLLKAGEKARARLKCNVGEHLSAFEVLNQPGNEDFFDNVEGAYPRKGGPRHAKIDTRKGKIRIRHNGEPDVNGVVDLDCDLPNGD